VQGVLSRVAGAACWHACLD